MPPKLSAIDSSDSVVTNIDEIVNIRDMDKDSVRNSRREQEKDSLSPVLAEYKRLFPLVEYKRSYTKGEGSDQANSAAPMGGPSGSKGTGTLVRPAEGSTSDTRRLKKNLDVVPSRGSVRSLPSDVRPSGDVSGGTIPVGRQSPAGEEPAEETSSGEVTDSDDGVDQWILDSNNNVNKSKVTPRADRVKDSNGKNKSSKIPVPSDTASNDNFELIMNALGQISNRLEDSDRRYESLREDLYEQRNSLNQIPAFPGLDAKIQRGQGAPKFPRDSSSRGDYNDTHRAKSHKSDKPTHEEDDVLEDYDANNQFRSNDDWDQDDHDENTIDDLDG